MHVFTYISNAELILYIPAVILTNSTEIQVSRGLFLIIIVSWSIMVQYPTEDQMENRNLE